MCHPALPPRRAGWRARRGIGERDRLCAHGHAVAGQDLDALWAEAFGPRHSPAPAAVRPQAWDRVAHTGAPAIGRSCCRRESEAECVISLKCRGLPWTGGSVGGRLTSRLAIVSVAGVVGMAHQRSVFIDCATKVPSPSLEESDRLSVHAMHRLSGLPPVARHTSTETHTRPRSA